LLGDYLYAQGLVHLSGEGSVEAVADMAELISLCAHLQAQGADGDGPAWAATVALLGRAPLRETAEPEALLVAAERTAGADAVGRALAAHAARVG
jgi:hypothetical protein